MFSLKEEKNCHIFSKSKNASTIISAELSLLGFNVKLLTEPPSQKDAELIVLDATELALTTQIKSFISSCHGVKKIAIISNPSEKLSARFDKILVFPFLLSELCDFVLESATAKTSSKKNDEPAHEKCFIQDKDKEGVSIGDIFISLSSYEFKLLSLLCENSGNCVSKADILSLFNSSDSNIAEVYICHLRNKIENPLGIKVIYTVRGKGYMTDYIMK